MHLYTSLIAGLPSMLLLSETLQANNVPALGSGSPRQAYIFVAQRAERLELDIGSRSFSSSRPAISTSARVTSDV